MPRRLCSGLLVVATLAAVSAGAAACGSSNDDVPSRPRAQRLTEAERAQAAAGYAAIRAYCRRLGLSLTGQGPAPGPRFVRGAIGGARTIASLARRKPDARFSRSQSARELAADTAEDLEGTNCSGRLVAELARGL